MGKDQAIKAMVESTVEYRVEEHGAWPKNMLRLELECLEKMKGDGIAEGVYQGYTWEHLKRMERAGDICEFEVVIDDEEHSFIAEPDCSTIKEEVKERFERVANFLEKSGHFGALVAYVALCAVWDELDNTRVQVMPEGSYDVLYHVERVPDAFMIYPNEYVPVEVYNGRDYLDTPGKDYESDKYNQLEDYADVPVGHELNCHPFLISRRSTDDIKRNVREWNGMVIDTDCIIACETRRPDIEDDLDFFNITQSVEFVPKIETADGTRIDGTDYKAANSDSGFLRPRSMIAENKSKIPPFYMQRVRGGVQLHYVNSYYRRRHDTDSTQACRVVQELYNQLLRQAGKDRNSAVSDAWEEVKFGDAIDPAREENIKEEVENIINQLISQRVIYRDRNTLYARKSEHPQQGLRFTA